MSELKPCPFCGDAPERVPDNEYPKACCTTHKCALEGLEFGVTEWNQRVEPDAPLLVGKVIQMGDIQLGENSYDTMTGIAVEIPAEQLNGCNLLDQQVAIHAAEENFK